MRIWMIILAELIRLYLLGLIVMALFSILFGVSWTGIAAWTGWVSVAFTPPVLGAWTSLAIEAGEAIHEKTKEAFSWICSRKA